MATKISFMQYICRFSRSKLMILLVLFSTISFATHERSGYITYSSLGNGMYQFKIYTWTNLQSVASDRCELILYIDGTDSVICPRINGTGPCPNGGNGVDGIAIVASGSGYGGIKENIY